MAHPLIPVPAGTPPQQCKSCGRVIYWIITAAQKRMPVDCTVTSYGAVAPTAMTDGGGVSHFATCPNAAQHRRAK